MGSIPIHSRFLAFRKSNNIPPVANDMLIFNRNSSFAADPVVVDNSLGIAIATVASLTNVGIMTARALTRRSRNQSRLSLRESSDTFAERKATLTCAHLARISW